MLLALRPLFSGDTPPPPTPTNVYFRMPDVLAMLSLIGENVTVAGSLVKGIVDRNTDIIFEALGGPPMHANTIMVTIATDSAANLVVGAAAIVQGVTLKIWKMNQPGDGALIQLFCARY